MTSRDIVKATLGQSKNRDILDYKCGTKVCTFRRLGVEGLRQRCNTSHW